MTSDEERREVARKLREDAANDKLREQVFVEEIIAGCIGETMHDEWGNVREVEILTRLADLIDRPTCHNASGHQDVCAQKPRTRKRAIYLVTDFGGDQEDAWERSVIAFTDKARAEECAAKRETRQYDEYGPIWDYEGSEVKEIPLVDFGDRQEETSRYEESACAGL